MGCLYSSTAVKGFMSTSLWRLIKVGSFFLFSYNKSWHLLKPVMVTHNQISLGVWWGGAVIHPRNRPQNRTWVASVLAGNTGEGQRGKGRASAAGQGTQQAERSKYSLLLFFHIFYCKKFIYIFTFDCQIWIIIVMSPIFAVCFSGWSLKYL